MDIERTVVQMMI